MRTTLDLPDDLFRRVKAKAALKGVTLKDLLTGYVQNGLREGTRSPADSRPRSRLPVIRKREKRLIPNLTSQLQAEIEEKEDLARLDRSFGG